MFCSGCPLKCFLVSPSRVDPKLVNRYYLAYTSTHRETRLRIQGTRAGIEDLQATVETNNAERTSAVTIGVAMDGLRLHVAREATMPRSHIYDESNRTQSQYPVLSCD